MKLKITLGTWQLDVDGDAAEVNQHATVFYRLCSQLAQLNAADKAATQVLNSAAGDLGGKGH